MAKSNHRNDRPTKKPDSPDHSASDPKKFAAPPAPQPPVLIPGVADVPMVPSVSAGNPSDFEDEPIENLRERLRQHRALLEDRDAELDDLQAQLHGKDAVLKEKDLALAELEKDLSAQIQSLVDQLKARDETLARREAEIDSLRELLDAETGEKARKREARNQSTIEIDRLIEEQRAAKLALAKVEIEEWHVIGRRNAWKRALRAIQKMFELKRKQEDQAADERSP